MKKILILIMSCQNEFFVNQENDCQQTYLNNLPDNFDYIIYRGGYPDFKFNEKTHVLEVPGLDTIDNTFTKTYYALHYITNNLKIEYDYIFRTNTSTYINIDLLNNFVNSLTDEKEIWGGEIFYLQESNQKFNDIYLRGNGLLFSKYNINIILNNSYILCFVNNIFTDDWTFFVVFKYFYSIQNINYVNYVKSFKEGWFKSTVNPYSNHQVCNMNNENSDFEFLKHMMTIQIKNWYNRDLESEHYKIIDNVFKTNKDFDIENTVKEQYDYSENPDIFLGEHYGYITFNELIRNGSRS